MKRVNKLEYQHRKLGDNQTDIRLNFQQIARVSGEINSRVLLS